MFAAIKTGVGILITHADRQLPVSQYVKRWPADLAGPVSSPATGEILTVNWVSLHPLRCHDR